MGGKLDTRAIGLDGGLHFIRWLMGAENLHYGFWDGLDPTAGNLRAAQDAYSDLLFSCLPDRKLRILDIGGGAGETARKLLAMGHSVDIVIPSAVLAARCRENAPDATVHECKFQDFQTQNRCDLCLVSESYQYIPLDTGLSHALGLLNDGGEVLIADCFRLPGFITADGVQPGGGHPLADFETLLDTSPVEVIARQDITKSVAPSIDLEQGLFNVIGHVLSQLDDELAAKKPAARWSIHRLIRLFMNQRRRTRLASRLMDQKRTSAAFIAHNSYQIIRLARA